MLCKGCLDEFTNYNVRISGIPTTAWGRVFYYALPPKFSHWAKSTIAVLDLHNDDEEYLSDIFHKGIKTLLRRKGLSGKAACAILENHATENIKDFAQDILQKVITEIIHSETENPNQP